MYLSFILRIGLCETDNVNKAGYTPVMLAALTAAESPDELEVAQQLLKKGDVNARSRQVLNSLFKEKRKEVLPYSQETSAGFSNAVCSFIHLIKLRSKGCPLSLS